MILTKSKLLPQYMAVLLFIATISQEGCTAATRLRGEPGKDIGNIQLGITREEAEQVLGVPLREWTTSSLINYCVYLYDAGVPPDVMGAIVLTYANIMTLGLGEILEAKGFSSQKKAMEKLRVFKKIAIAYDAESRIVGIFDNFSDFDLLPPDGRKIDRRP